MDSSNTVLEYCAPVWHPGLTCAQSDKLEAVQRRAVRTILGRRFTSYEQGRTDLNLPLLSDRRQKLCLKFGTHLESHTPSMLPPKGSDYHDRTTRNRDNLELKSWSLEPLVEDFYTLKTPPHFWKTVLHTPFSAMEKTYRFRTHNVTLTVRF
ncbi:hypothetical protein Bbelb_322120 [Branchiostoma belcheri]|nr:hypothetical protein Bbelb_322120 [Branchiostoma belcheri]